MLFESLPPKKNTQTSALWFDSPCAIADRGARRVNGSVIVAAPTLQHVLMKSRRFRICAPLSIHLRLRRGQREIERRLRAFAPFLRRGRPHGADDFGPLGGRHAAAHEEQ